MRASFIFYWNKINIVKFSAKSDNYKIKIQRHLSNISKLSSRISRTYKFQRRQSKWLMNEIYAGILKAVLGDYFGGIARHKQAL
jgi:hypothetical protein